MLTRRLQARQGFLQNCVGKRCDVELVRIHASALEIDIYYNAR